MSLIRKKVQEFETINGKHSMPHLAAKLAEIAKEGLLKGSAATTAATTAANTASNTPTSGTPASTAPASPAPKEAAEAEKEKQKSPEDKEKEKSDESSETKKDKEEKEDSEEPKVQQYALILYLVYTLGNLLKTDFCFKVKVDQKKMPIKLSAGFFLKRNKRQISWKI